VSRIRIHLDEDCQAHALAQALRQHGIDAKTTNELALSGVNDERQLEAAHQAARVLVTNNICDFVPLHGRWLAEGRTHSGIIVFPQQELSVGEAVRRLARLIHTLRAEDMVNRLEWLNSWGTPKPVRGEKNG
jgi:Domain of unknown function (DUF5615)